MTLNKYQEKAMATRMPSCDNFSYMFLNLVGEVGEFASKVAKAIRKGKVTICEDEYDIDYIVGSTQSYDENYVEHRQALKLEAGDILWQLAGLCDYMGWTLEDVAQENLAKLADRQKRNKIDGEGDNR